MKKVIQMDNNVTKRSELLFLYDIKDANPNGDPLDDNKPRIDEETKINIVTDVRLKRTVRDYFNAYLGYDGTNGNDIFVREISVEDGSIQDAKLRALDFLDEDSLTDEDEKEIVRKFNSKDGKISKKDVSILKKSISNKLLASAIDARLFGLTLPLEFSSAKVEGGKNVTDSITYTGPVQFQMGRSLHPVDMMYIKGTGAFASKQGAGQKTFREEYVLPYSLIGFYGIINENAAKHTKLSEKDVNLLLEGLWLGTKNLISRSKAGQVPRLLFKINYSEPNFFIGDLKGYIYLNPKVRAEAIRDVVDYEIDLTKFMELIQKYDDKIESIQYIVDDRLELTANSGQMDFSTNSKFLELTF